MQTIHPEFLFANQRREINLDVKYHHVRDVFWSYPEVADDEILACEDGNRAVASKGGACVAYYQPQPGTIVYAVAHCHPNDNYNKKLGRMKAAGRLLSPQHQKIYRF